MKEGKVKVKKSKPSNLYSAGLSIVGSTPLLANNLLSNPILNNTPLVPTPIAVPQTDINKLPAPNNPVQSEAATSPETEINPTEEAIINTGQEESSTEVTVPITPEEDPNFQALVQRTEKVSDKQAAHEPSKKMSASAQAAAPSPSNERMSKAQDEQVKHMDKQEAKEFNAVDFKNMLLARIAEVLPKNEKEADDFVDSGKMEEVKNSANTQVANEKTNTAGAIQTATQQEPNTEVIPERKIEAVQNPKARRVPNQYGAGKGMPPTRPAQAINQPLQDNVQEVEGQLAAENITDEQLANSNEPSFVQALDSTNQARSHAQTAPDNFRTEEQNTLQTSQKSAEQNTIINFQSINSNRKGLLSQVVGVQGNTSQNDTGERQRIAKEIGHIFVKTKTDIEAILTALDGEVDRRFDKGNGLAKDAFEKYVDLKMAAYKKERYSGIGGAFTWVGDVFTGLPDEVNDFFLEGRQIYIDWMDKVLTNIANYVATQLKAAKKRIQEGKEAVKNYVEDLPANLQNLGKEAANEIQSKFEELESDVNSKQEEIVDTLAQKYSETLQEVDARIEEMKAANRGLIDIALDAVVGVIETIINIKNMLLNLLQGLMDVVVSVIKDPIGFLGNLISGVSAGITNFGSNILKHLTNGLVTWLTGALGPVGISIPENLFSLKGIFSLVGQILGITWNFIRRKAVKLLGEPVMKVLETGFELFQILRKDGLSGLWEYIKEKFNDLKETVLGAIQDMVITQVIQAGIKWLLGLLNPASAFVKAAMAIIDIVKFFIQRGSQIIQLVQAFIEGVKAVASGSVEKVAGAIENALGKAVPVIIGFLAALLGISGLANKVTGLVKKIRIRIEKAIDNLLNSIKNAARKLFRKLTGKKDKKKGELQDSEVGKEIKFNVNGESHRLWIAQGNGKTKSMLASNPKEVETHLEEKKQQLQQEPNESLKTNISKVENINKEVNSQAQDTSKKLVAANKPKASVQEIASFNKSDDNLEKKEDELKVGIIPILQSGEGVKVPEVYYNPGFNNNKASFFEARYVYKNAQGEKNHADGDHNTEGKIDKSWQILINMGQSSNWVRFHILNAELGGKASDSNLIPTLGKINNPDYLSKFETPLKKIYKKDHKPIWFRASVDYHNDFDLFPKRYEASGGALKYESKKWIEDNSQEITSYKRGLDIPRVQIINLNEVFNDFFTRKFIMNQTIFTGALIDFLKDNQPSGGYSSVQELIDVIENANDKKQSWKTANKNIIQKSTSLISFS